MNLNSLYKSIFFELTAILSLLIKRNIYSAFLFFIFHGIASFLISTFIITITPKEYKKRIKLNLVLFTVFNTVTLFIGYIFSFYLVFILLKKLKHQPVYKINTMLNLYNIFPQVKRQLGEGVGNIIIGNKKLSRNMKLKVINTLLNEINYSSIKIIKNFLSDEDSEIRLYSYQILNDIKNKINKNIVYNIKRIDEVIENKGTIYKTLTNLYYQIIVIGIFDDFIKDFFINKVIEYLNKTEEFFSDYELLLIRADILKIKKEYDKALFYYDKALKYGVDDVLVYPNVAEIYFELKEYDKVKEIMTKEPRLKFYFHINPVVQTWGGSIVYQKS